jgi:hypothetical protein
MAASATQNPAVRSESKSAKKKKAKAEVAAASAPSSSSSGAAETTLNAATESNQGDSAYESPYIKELYK